MLKRLLIGLAFACAGCASDLPDEQFAAAPNCRQFSAPVSVDGTTQQLVGLACQQPDGTWRPVESLPPLYASPAYAVSATPPDTSAAPNCAYPMAAQYTEQCNWYINRHKAGHH